MKNEIGSIFPINSAEVGGAKLPADGRVYLSLCREALLYIARKNYAAKVVLMPAYTCDAVYIPFLQEGWTLRFYSITREMRIDTVSLQRAVAEYQPSVVIAHPYFGYDFNQQEEDTLQQIQDAAIVIDNTQCAFTERRYAFANYTIASLRKWGPIPDGAYVEGGKTTVAEGENDSFVSLQQKAMELRAEYFQTGDAAIKSESIRLNKQAEALICSNMEVHAMSAFSQNRYAGWDVADMCQKRIANYTYLHEHLSGIEGILPVRRDITGLTTAPLYYPIYCEDRGAVQKKLAQHAIFAPVIWLADDAFVLIDDEVKYIYDHVLCLLVDQRYDTDDMKQIIEVLRQ